MVSNAATKLIDEARGARGGRVVPLRRSLCLELCWVRFLGEEGRVVEESVEGRSLLGPLEDRSRINVGEFKAGDAPC